MMLTALQHRGLRPVGELAAGRPHGDRLRYMAGCRCDLCRKANSAYECARVQARKNGDWNGIVNADKARAHINRLAYHGMGRRAVSDACDIAESLLFAIAQGTRKHIRARTERKILEVSLAAAADHSLIDAGPTWKLLNALLQAGYTKARLALELGSKTPALQVRKTQVTVRTAHNVRQLHDRLINSDETPIDARPTRRLLANLLYEGYTLKQIARHLGCAESTIDSTQARVTQGFARRVLEVHRQLTE